jgi:hypothetical protein
MNNPNLGAGSNGDATAHAQAQAGHEDTHNEPNRTQSEKTSY